MRIFLSSVAVLVLSTAALAADGPSGWKVERNEEGEVVARRDAYGNWSSYRSTDQGRSTTITHFRNRAGRWQEKWIRDAEGHRVVELVRQGSPRLGDYVRLLRRFGVSPGKPVAEAELGWQKSTDDDAARFIVESPFGRFERLELLVGGAVVRRETTSVLDRSFGVEIVPSEGGYLLRDEAGGWRGESYDAAGLVSARDAHGDLVDVERDHLGRPVSYRLGELGLLRFTYGDSTPQWVSKEVIDLRSGEVLFRWESAVLPGTVGPEAEAVTTRPRASIRFLIPGHGAVAEWDETLYPDGVMVARVGDHPYALVPFDPQLDIVRSVTIFEASAARGWDRVDYTDDQLFVHVTTDAGDSDSAEQTAIVVLPRHAAAKAERKGAAAPAVSVAVERSALRRQAAPLISVRPCGDPNVGCTCLDWNNGQEVRCPETTGGTDDGGGGDGSEPPEPTGGGGGGGGYPTADPLTPRQTFILNNAKPVAQRALADHESCRDLFADLNRTDGAWVLANTTYRNWSQNSNCSGNNAFTVPNWLTVYLCSGFEALGVNDAAATLIHEGLHSAGMLESPKYPNEMTSSQIQALVEQACHL
jgi:hypothetical protein